MLTYIHIYICTQIHILSLRKSSWINFQQVRYVLKSTTGFSLVLQVIITFTVKNCCLCVLISLQFWINIFKVIQCFKYLQCIYIMIIHFEGTLHKWWFYYKWFYSWSQISLYFHFFFSNFNCISHCWLLCDVWSYF